MVDTPITNLIPMERFLAWSVLAPSLIDIGETDIIVEWREDALGTPIQPLRLIISGDCCYAFNEFNSECGTVFYLQTFVKKTRQRWFVRNFANAYNPFGSPNITNFIICDDEEVPACSPPVSPGTMKLSDLSSQIDQWIFQSDVLIGSKTNFFLYNPDFIPCCEIDEECPEPGWYVDFTGTDFVKISQEFLNNNPPVYVENSDALFLYAAENFELLRDTMVVFYGVFGDEYVDWEYYNSGPDLFLIQFDPLITYTGKLRVCLDQCPEGFVYDTVSGSCKRSCGEGFILIDDVCVPDPGGIQLDYGESAFVTGESTAISYSSSLFTSARQEDPLPCLNSTSSDSGVIGSPSVRSFPFDPAVGFTLLDTSVTESSSEPVSNPNGYTTCNPPDGAVSNSASNNWFITALDPSGQELLIDTYDSFGDITNISPDGWSVISNSQSVSWRIHINGGDLMSYSSPWGAPPTITPISPGPCTLCVTVTIGISVIVPIRVINTLSDGTKEQVLAYDLDLGRVFSITLPPFCGPVPADIDPQLLSVGVFFTEQAIDVAINLAVDTLFTALFPTITPIVTQFADITTDLSYGIYCPE